MPSGGSFLAFDGLVPPNTTALASPSVAWKRHTTLSPVVELDSRPTSSASSDAESEVERERGVRGFLRSMMGGSKARSKSRGAPARASHRLSVASAPVATSAPPMPNELSRSATDDLRMLRSPASASAGGEGSGHSTPPIRHRNCSFKFSLEFHAKQHSPGPMRLVPPRLPAAAQAYVQSQSAEVNSPLYMSRAVEPSGASVAHSKYAGRALAEWTIVIMECQSFFERRKNEGAPDNRYVETPTLGVEVFSKRP